MKRILIVRLLAAMLTFASSCAAWADSLIPATTTQAGRPVELGLAVRNDTAMEHTYQLSIRKLPASLNATIVAGGTPAQVITVKPGDLGPVSVRIDVPPETPVGLYTLQFEALRDDNVKLLQVVSLNVDDKYAVRIVGQVANVSVFSGKEFSFIATAQNSGSATVTNVELVVDTPVKWVVRPNPSVVASLDPGQTITFDVKVLVPSSQAPVDQTVLLHLSSDQVPGPGTAIDVRVQKSPGYLVASAALVIFGVAAVLLYIRRKGRR